MTKKTFIIGILAVVFSVGIVVTVSAKVDSPDFRPGFYIVRGSSNYQYPMIYIGDRYDDDTVPVSFHNANGRTMVEVTGRYTDYGKITLPRRIDGDNLINMYNGRIFNFAGRQYELRD